MNDQAKLKLQAYLDGELSANEATRVSEWLAGDAEARALSEELRAVTALLGGNELEIKLPESREFYWSKIEKAIAPPSQERNRAHSGPAPWWLRVVAPVAAVLMIGTLLFSMAKLTANHRAMAYVHEIEVPLEDTSSISFHSQAAGMTVVWVQSPGN